MMDVRPIRTPDDYAWALGEVEGYFDNQPAPGTPEADRFDVLADLIEAYENRKFPIEMSDPIDVLRFCMEQSGRTQKDLAELLGSAPRASEILNGKRRLTVDMISALQGAWHIPAGALLPAYEKAVA